MVPNLKAQTKWRWLIAAYLFLAGLGAGAYLTGVVAGFAGEAWQEIAKIGISLGLPCVAIGCLFLVADLGTPKNFWRAGKCPGTSWIARGTIIIAVFMILNAIHIAGSIWPFGFFVGESRAGDLLGALGALFAVATMIYTGILLGAARPIAFWSTAMLPLLFLVSALSTGIMAIVLIASMTTVGHAEPIRMLAHFDVMLIVLEMFVVGFYLQGTHRVSESRESARQVLAGDIAPLFWIGVALIGLVVPLVLELAELVVPASICGIIGGLCLRQVVLAGGIHAPLRAGRFEIGLPIV
jgi:polysulfide reductase chain C